MVAGVAKTKAKHIPAVIRFGVFVDVSWTCKVSLELSSEIKFWDYIVII